MNINYTPQVYKQNYLIIVSIVILYMQDIIILIHQLL